MDNEKTLQNIATELLTKPAAPPIKEESTGVRTQNRVYSNRENAIDGAKPYSNFVRQDVFVYESTYGTNDHQYTLRLLSELFSPESDFIIYREEYVAPLPKQHLPPTK